MTGRIEGEAMNIGAEQIRNYRLSVHCLDKKIPASEMINAAGVCGLQNSPPGAWETAMFNRLEGCSLQMLQNALYEEKSLLQAWSFRGTPVVFPTDQSDIFLTPLKAQSGEQPWIYTRGITAALDYLQMSFDDVLMQTIKAAKYLDGHTIRSKELLDKILAEIIEKDLPEEKAALWRAPSMYGHPDKQTIGGAAVSFLLRPCSFSSLVVFGRRQGSSPAFTSFKSWIGRAPDKTAGADRELVCKFLHSYGPADVNSFMVWLGCSGKQAVRIWNTVAEETQRVTVGKKTYYMLSEDMEKLRNPEKCEDRLLLLGAHDPYLDIKDRMVLLEDKSLHKEVWKTAANPGVILKGGRVAGIWRTKTQKCKLELSMALFGPHKAAEKKALEELAGEYAAFRMLELRSCSIANR